MRLKSLVVGLFAICLMAGVLFGCATHEEKPVEAGLTDAQIIEGLSGPVWVAEYINGKPVMDMSHSSMVFTKDGGVSGKGGCNSYSGTYSLEDGTLSFGPMAATMMMCAPSLDEQEMRFFQMLGTPQKVSFENELLILTPEAGEPSRFAIHNME